MKTVIDFAAARKRLDAIIEHSIEFTPSATFIERLAVRDLERLPEIVRTVWEESK